MRVVLPTVKDVSKIFELIEVYAESGVVLKRTPEEILKNINDFRVVKINEKVVGCVSLYIYTETLAELRTLIIHPENQGQGIGRLLVNHLRDLSAELKIKKLFTLTQQPDFFIQCGFKIIEKSSLPEKIFKDCNHCKYFDDCVETALQIVLATK